MLFCNKTAVNLTLAVTFLVFALLVSTPLRVHAFIALLLLYAIAFLVANRRALVLDKQDGWVMLVLSLYALSHIPSFLMSGYSWRYLAPGLHMVGIIPVYLMLRHVMGELVLARFRSVLEYGAVLGALGGGGIAVYEVYVLGEPRVDGFLFHINFGYLSASLFFLLVALLPSSQRRYLVGGGVFFALVATLLSTSRGAIFAIPIVFVVLFTWQWRRIGLRYLAYGVAGFVVVAVVSYSTVPLVEQRVDLTVLEVRNVMAGEFEHNSAGGRVRLWAAAVEAFKERPLVGLTYDEREALNAELAGTGIIDDWVASISRGHAHSQYFETLASGGLIGLVALFFYLVFPSLFCFQCYRRRSANHYYLVGFVFSLGFIIFCLSEVPLQYEMIGTYYAYTMVLLFVLAQKRDEALIDVEHGRILGPRSG